MVTHAVDFLHLADHVIILKKGEVKAKGTFDELVDDLDAGGGCRGDRATGERGPGLHSLLFT